MGTSMPPKTNLSFVYWFYKLTFLGPHYNPQQL